MKRIIPINRRALPKAKPKTRNSTKGPSRTPRARSLGKHVLSKKEFAYINKERPDLVKNMRTAFYRKNGLSAFTVAEEIIELVPGFKKCSRKQIVDLFEQAFKKPIELR